MGRGGSLSTKNNHFNPLKITKRTSYCFWKKKSEVREISVKMLGFFPETNTDGRLL